MTFEHWLDLICADPEDWFLRSAFADWLEENGEEEKAAGLRWMVREHKRPMKREFGRQWYGQEPGETDPKSDIPVELFNWLEGGESRGHFRTYRDPAQAEEDLLQAWVKAAAAGWQPEE